MAQKNQIDMLNGPLLKKILLFSLPLAASSVLQQLFNSIDVAVVGRFVGREALAAVGANSPVISLLINLFVGISMGANAIISNQIGAAMTMACAGRCRRCLCWRSPADCFSQCLAWRWHARFLN